MGGVAVCGMAFVSSTWLLLPLSVLSGAAGSLTLVGSQSSILQAAPKDYRTRIMALWGALAFGGMGLGGVVSGITASLISLPPTLILFGTVGTLGSGAIWLYARQRKPG